jgi:[CysO sulfur-carrier protein]-S-L-cysteine hydrolase
MNLQLAPGIVDQILEQARSSLPLECCGLIAGTHGVGARVIPMVNALASSVAYEMDPAELIAAMRSLRQSGDELAAIYHSHPNGPAEPSRSDIERAYYPEAAYLIVSLADVKRPVTRAFRIVDGQAMEIEVHAIV